jgi:MOSC domain-containing protein YiiM
MIKTPVDHPVYVGKNGLDEDGRAAGVHLTEYSAVYALGNAEYRFWANELGRADLSPGFFGENLTLEDFSDDEVMVGDQLRVGKVLLEATMPRLPCAKIALRVGDENFGQRFLDRGRPGIYFKVIEEGYLRKGDEPTWERTLATSVSIYDLVPVFLGEGTAQQIAAVLELPMLPPAWQERLLS